MAACFLMNHRLLETIAMAFGLFALKHPTGKGNKEKLNNKIWLKIC